jgi:hypothetical protein
MSKEQHPLENTLINLKDFKQELENYEAFRKRYGKDNTRI